MLASPQPAIRPSAAAALSILYTLVYVVPFYLSKTTRPSPSIVRDAPYVIRARIRAAVLATIANTLITIVVLHRYANAPLSETFKLMGYWPASLLDLGRVLLLCCVLFAGPLFEAGLADGQWREWIDGTFFRETFGSIIGWRNLVAGPITEELIWRSLVIPVHLMALPAAGTGRSGSYSSLVFVTPLYFGLAHLHHLYEFRLTHPRVPILLAVLRSVFQFGYTSVFGFFASFVFLRTGNVWACCIAHSFCNWMGLPRFWGRLEGVQMGPPVDEYTSDGPHPATSGVLGIWWTVTYYLLLVGGSIGFYQLLWPLTESQYALVEF